MLVINYAYNFTKTTDVVTSRWICKCIFFTVCASYTISSITWCLIAYSHYLKVSKPYYQCCGISKNHAMMTCELIAVIISCIIAAPYFQFANVYIDEPKFCDIPFISNEVSIFLIIQTILLYFAPSAFLVFIYHKIIRFISKYIQPQISLLNKRKVAQTKRLMKTIIMIMAFNVLLTWPYFATMLGTAITQKSHREIRKMNFTYYILVFYSIITTAAITIVNPMLLFTLDQQINAAIKRILQKLQFFCCGFNS